MYGSGNADKEITSNLTARTDMVTVTLNYRLNAFGFLALSELTNDSPWSTSGNYGFYDQIMALKVCKANKSCTERVLNKIFSVGSSEH